MAKAVNFPSIECVETVSSASIQMNYGAFEDRACVQIQEVTVHGRPAYYAVPAHDYIRLLAALNDVKRLRQLQVRTRKHNAQEIEADYEKCRPSPEEVANDRWVDELTGRNNIS